MRNAVVLAIAVLVGVGAFGVHGVATDGGHYDATNTQTLTSNAINAARGEQNVFTVPAGDHNFSNVVMFEPLGVTITPSCNIPGGRDRNNDGDALDAGETTTCLASTNAAGTQTSGWTLGLTNNACNSGLTVVHDLYVVPTPNNETNPRASTNIVYPRPQGSTDRFGGWQVGFEPAPAGGTAPVDMDSNARADAGSLAFQAYPSYLLDYFDPDGAGPVAPAVPEAAYGGLTSVAGTWVPWYLVQFTSGTLNTAFAGQAPHPFTRFANALGHPNQLVVNDPTSALSSPSSITDVCSPLVASTVLNATVGGVTRATNPSTTGTHMSLAWSASLRDLDNDGYENALDSCPRNANTEDPRNGSGPDADMLDSVCDPTPGADTNAGDHDGDGWTNAIDNCPLAPNPTQADNEITVPADYAVHAADGGPLGDQIGDACDIGPAVGVTINFISYSITPSATVSNGHWHIQANPLPKCYGGTDIDGDGYCTTQDTADAGACANAVPPNCTVRHNAWSTTAAYSATMAAFDTDRGGGDTAGAADTGGTGTIACPGGAADVCPENSFDSDWFEDYVGTDPAMPCSLNSGANNEGIHHWQFDFNDDQRASISDVVAMGPSFGKFVNAPGGTRRTDINADGHTSISDVTAFGPMFNKQCRGPDGTFGGVQ